MTLHTSFVTRLILVTKTRLDHLPRLVSSQCSVVLFHPDCSGLESRLLDEFLEIQNPKTFSERTEIRKVLLSVVAILFPFEELVSLSGLVLLVQLLYIFYM